MGKKGAGSLKRESFSFSDDPLRNVHICGDAKVLQLCLKKSDRIAKRRIQESAFVLTLSGAIRIESEGKEELLRTAEAVVLEPAEEHAVEALEDSVLLLVLLPKTREASVSYARSIAADETRETWKDALLPEFLVLAADHKKIIALLDGLREFDIKMLDPVLSKVADLLGDSGQVQALFQTVEILTDLLLAHFEKEDLHFLPMAGRLITESERRDFIRQWKRQDPQVELDKSLASERGVSR